MSKGKIGILSDSAKVHTGFGTVIAPIALGFHNAGYDVHMYGFLDHEIDKNGILPYKFYPTPYMDDLAHSTHSMFLRRVEPDIVFILTDPGNLYRYAYDIIERELVVFKRNGKKFTPPIVAYTPIEGSPQPKSHGEAMRLVQKSGGVVIVYCQSAKEKVVAEFPDISPIVIHHGLDHFQAARYSNKDRRILRELAGLDDKFMIASGGVNKRTKGFTTLVYAAAEIKRLGRADNIMFYCHTNPREDTMWGYKLLELVKYYGVDDMFLFKPNTTGSYWIGRDRCNGTLEQARKIKGQTPPTPQGRGYLFSSYDFVSMINCMDLYVDSSQVEGWGLIPGEFMACGVPVISVHDNHVRDEIYRAGAWMIQPLDCRNWSTWHSGQRLVEIDPVTVAQTMLFLKETPELRQELSIRGMEVAGRYTWEKSVKKFVNIVDNIMESI